MPERVAKLIRRLLELTRGRWQIILTVGPDDEWDWTVTELGKVEKA